MPIFYEHTINDRAKLAVWHISEPESFFTEHVFIHREISHPNKRLQHLAGRYLLPYLFPGFPHHLIAIADTRKPFLPDEDYHFSIAHCGNYAAAIVSKERRVGIDIELASAKIQKIKHKFLGEEEMRLLPVSNLRDLTILWAAKEAVFKWSGGDAVDFKEHIHLDIVQDKVIVGRYLKNLELQIKVDYRNINELSLAFIIDP